MNNNFSKNFLSKGNETKIAGNPAFMNRNTDGGIRSLDEVRTSQMNARNGREANFKVSLNSETPKSFNNTNFYSTRDRLQAMNHLNNNSK